MRRLRLTPRRVAVLLAATVGISAGVAYAATLSVGSWHLWAGSQTLTKATCTLTGTAQTTDTYVDNSSTANMSNNSGPRTTMLVRPNATNQQWSFVSLRPLQLRAHHPDHRRRRHGDAQALRSRARRRRSRTLTLTPVLTTWSETGLTWTSAQSAHLRPHDDARSRRERPNNTTDQHPGHARRRRADQEPVRELRLEDHRRRRQASAHVDVRNVRERNRRADTRSW